MPSRKKLAQRTMHASIGPSDDPLNITFLPEMLTPQGLKALLGAAKMGSAPTAASVEAGLDGLVNLLADVLVEWNLTEDDEPESLVIPLTFDGISGVSFVLLQHIAEAIVAEISPGEANGTPSSVPTKPLS
jgi:hypothetical protein